MPLYQKMDKVGLFKKFALVLIGQGGGQLIRLISNLVLTRLLVPEMFGVMAVLNSILLGLKFMTDVGLRGSVMNTTDIRSNKFLETVWTTQLLRGAGVYLALVLISTPVETYFQIDNFSKLLIVLGISVVIDSFASVNVLIYQRKMKVKELMFIDIGSQLVGVITMVLLAFYYHSIWSLVYGSIVASIVRALITHTHMSGPKMHIGWNTQTFLNLFSYGKWVFLSTFGAYLVLHADKIIFVKFIDLNSLGVLAIASNLALIVTNVFNALSGKIFFPLYSDLARKNSQALYPIFRLRMILIGGAFVLVFAINIAAEPIVNLLYDDRYQNAGWMLQVLSLGGILQIMDMTLRPLLLAHKDSLSSMKVQLTKSLVFVVGLITSLHFFGIIGGILALAILQISGQGLLLRYAKRHGYQWSKIEYGLIFFFVVSFASSWYFQYGTTWLKLQGLQLIPLN